MKTLLESSDRVADESMNPEAHVLALGVFAMILGTLGVMSLPFAMQPNWADYSGIRGGVVADRSPVATWGVLSTTLYCGLSLMALIGGSACVGLKWWARPIMLAYGAGSVVLGVIGIYFHWRIIQISRADLPMPTFGFRVTSLAEWGIWGYGALLGAYALWVMSRPQVKKEFAAPPESPAAAG